MDDQLAAYREAQRRKHEQVVDSQGSTITEPSSEEERRSAPSPLYPSLAPTATTREAESTFSSRPLYPSLHPTRTSVQPPSPHEGNVDKVRQYEEDERIARQLQEQEREQRQAPPVRDDDSDQISDDEELAHLLQEEEEIAVTRSGPAPPSYSTFAPSAPPVSQATHTHPQDTQQQQQEQQPQQQEGWLATIGRGIRGIYDMYQQASQQVAQQQQQQQQIHSDEELARRLQAEEAGTARTGPMFQVFSPTMGHRGNYPNFYNDDDMYDDEDEQELFPTNLHTQDPLARLRETNSIFRSMGAPPEHPLVQHLQEMMRQAGQPSGPPSSSRGGGMRIVFAPPAQRYRFPRPVWQHMRGVETLPPELLNMMEGESDTSYESLLQLADRLQPVSRGASSEQIDQLPTKTYTEGSLPEDQKSCGVCLSDYENGDQLRTLPGCFHSFHKDCVDKWLQINKVCPMCRHEITETGDNTQ